MTTIIVHNETNSKAYDFQISISKRKLSHEVTQQQHRERHNWKYFIGRSSFIIYTCCCCYSEPRHYGTINQFLEMQSAEPAKHWSIVQDFKIIVTSSTLCIQCKEKSFQLCKIDTSQVGLKECLKLHCHSCS